jgi:hypothetical protein
MVFDAASVQVEEIRKSAGYADARGIRVSRQKIFKKTLHTRFLEQVR